MEGTFDIFPDLTLGEVKRPRGKAPFPGPQGGRAEIGPKSLDPQLGTSSSESLDS